MKLRSSSIALVIVALAFAQRASADPPTAPPTDPKVVAKDSFAKGNAYFNQAEATHDAALYEAAYLQYKQAYAVYPRDTVLWNLLAAELRTKRYVDALTHLREYDAHEHVTTNPADPKHPFFEQFRDEAFRNTGHIAVSAGAGATIRVDDGSVGTAPLTGPIDVAAGHHVVAASLAAQSTRIEVDAPAGQTVTANLLPAAAPQLPEPPTGVSTPPDRAHSRPDAATPQHDVAPAARTIAVLSSLGVAVVGLGVGIGFSLDASSRADTLSAFQASHRGSCATNAPSTCPAQSLVDDHDRSVNIAAAGWIVAGLGVAAAGAFWFFWPKSSSPSSGAWIAPMVGRSAGGMQLGGSF